AVIALEAKALEPSLPRGAKETDRSLFDGPGRSARHVERRRSRGAPLRRWQKETDRSLLVAHITSPSWAERPEKETVRSHPRLEGDGRPLGRRPVLRGRAGARPRSPGPPETLVLPKS